MIHHITKLTDIIFKYPCLIFEYQTSDWYPALRITDMLSTRFQASHANLSFADMAAFNRVMQEIDKIYSTDNNCSFYVEDGGTFGGGDYFLTTIKPTTFKCNVCALFVGERNKTYRWFSKLPTNMVCGYARSGGADCRGTLIAT